MDDDECEYSEIDEIVV